MAEECIVLLGSSPYQDCELSGLKAQARCGSAGLLAFFRAVLGYKLLIRLQLLFRVFDCIQLFCLLLQLSFTLFEVGKFLFKMFPLAFCFLIFFIIGFTVLLWAEGGI